MCYVYYIYHVFSQLQAVQSQYRCPGTRISLGSFLTVVLCAMAGRSLFFWLDNHQKEGRLLGLPNKK